MALPTVQKTWQISANNRLTSDTMNNMWRKMMRAIKNVLIGFPTNAPQVVACSDSTVVADYWDGVDRWDSDTDIVWALAGNPHSWIVLERIDGAQIVLDCNETSWNQAFVGFSPGGLYTGGDNTTRPTATDECNSTQWSQTGIATDYWCFAYTSNYDGDAVIHGWCSTDGLIQRIAIFRDGYNLGLWRFEVMQDAPTGLLKPIFASLRINTSSPPSFAGDITTPSAMHDHQQGQFYANSLIANIYTSTFDDPEWPSNDYGQTPNQIDGTLPLTELSLVSSTVGARGWKGSCIDVWLTSYVSVQNGATFPANPLTRNFVCVGALVLPWTGDCTGMLVA